MLKTMEEKGRSAYLICCELRGKSGGGNVGNHSVKGPLTPPEALELGLMRGAEPQRRESGWLQYATVVKEP